MKEINKVLALVCILREENFTKPGTYTTHFLIYILSGPGPGVAGVAQATPRFLNLLNRNFEN